MGFPHTTLISASDDGTIVELSFCDLNFQLQKTSSRQAPSSLLAIPYQPNGNASGNPTPSLLKNDDTVGFTKHGRRMDYTTIGRSAVSARKRKIEYSIEQGRLATAGTGSPIEALTWMSDSPFNFITGNQNGEFICWSIKLKHRHALINWLSKANVSVQIDPVVSVKAHSHPVTAIAYPAIRRSEDALLASASLDGVKLWDLNSLRGSSYCDYELRRFSSCVGISESSSGVPRYDISVSPEYILRGHLSGLAARRLKP